MAKCKCCHHELGDSLSVELSGGRTFRIFQDEEGGDSRDWDNLGKMICFHGRYNLGDKHGYRADSFTGWDDLVKQIEVEEGPIISLPLYLYDHSGLTMNTTGFSCPWDSGQVGIIYVSLAKVREEYWVKRVSQELRAKVCGYLRGEVATYDQELRGEVYYFVIKDAEGEVLDSCAGFYGGDPCENGMLDNLDEADRAAIEAAAAA